MTTSPSQSRIEEAVAVGRAGFISHFTPSLMVPKALEDIFVGRDELAAELVEQIETSALSEAKQHTLLVGPRGIGKSHLVALTYYRVKANSQVSERLRIAWLHEEEYGVTSWLDLLLRIFRALEEEYPSTTPQEQLEALYSLKTAEAEREAERLLREYIGERTLLLLVENLDEIFAGLKDTGQKQWRAFLQQYPLCATLATSPSLFNGVSRQTSPFYGFFRIRNLEPLTVDTAVDLLRKLALYRGDADLAEFLTTPAGRARVRAVHHLAGGNHRIYVIFSQFLDRRSLDELVKPFLNMLDELTPYYQSRMFLLSPQQRKMVEVLCAQRGAVTVKVLAHRGFMSQQTASSQLQDLRDKGYAVSHIVGRESFHELREPMMRLCLEVKKQRGEPIGLFVQFLRVWYSREQLQKQVELLPPERHFERRYLMQAIEGLLEEDPPTIVACIQEFDRLFLKRDLIEALKVVNDLVSLRGNVDDFYRRGICQYAIKDFKEALQSFNQAIDLDSRYSPAYYSRSLVFQELGEPAKAHSDIDLYINLESDVGGSLTSDDFLTRGDVLGMMGRYSEALQDFNKALRLRPNRKEKAQILARKGLALAFLKRWHRAISALQNSIQTGVEEPWVHTELGRAFFVQGDYSKAMSHLNFSIAKESQRILLTQAMLLRCLVATYTQDFELSLSDTEKVLTAEPKSPIALYVRTQALLSTGRWEEGIVAFEESLAITGVNAPFASTRILLSRWQLWAFKRQPDVALWTKRCHQLAKLYNRFGEIIAIEQGIVEIASSLAQSLMNASGDEDTLSMELKTWDWLEPWKRGGRNFPELALPLRLSEAAINFALSNDERILLALPIEERRIVQEMLNLDTEQTERTPALKSSRDTKPRQPKRAEAPAKPKANKT